MRYTRIPVRYAKALFQLAKERDAMDAVHEDVKLILKACTEVDDLKSFLASPVAANPKKAQVLSAIFRDKVHDISLKLLLLVAEKNRENYLPDICRNYITFFKNERKIVTVKIATASEMDDALRSDIKNIVGDTYNSKIELSEKVDEALIGGIIIRIDDMQYDASVATGLRQIKRDLINITFETRFVKTTDPDPLKRKNSNK